MSNKFSSKLFSRLAKVTAAVLVAAMLPSCGGGGGEEIPYTFRPKTLRDLVLVLANGPRLEFLPGALSGRAINNGETETGTLTYILPADQRQQYPNFEGSDSDCQWPDELIDITYEYTAINDNAALLTIYATAVNDLTFTGSFNAANGSFCFFWESDSLGTAIEEVEFDLTFSSDGANVSPGNVTTRIPDSAAPNFDIVYIPSQIETSDGMEVPENWNPEVDPNAPSDIAQPTLNNQVINFTNGIPDTNFDFTADFTATVVTPPESKLDPNDPDEIGTLVLRVSLGGPIFGAGDYTYRRINGTDDAILVISGTGTTFDRSYTLNWFGRDNGDYIGGGVNPAEGTGTFFMPNAPDFTEP